MEALDQYNRSFEEVLEEQEEDDFRLRLHLKQSVRKYIEDMTRRQREWDTTFRDLLQQSADLHVTFADEPQIKIIEEPPEESAPQDKPDCAPDKPIETTEVVKRVDESEPKATEKPRSERSDSYDPFPSEALDYFTNHLALQEFLRVQQQQERNREIFNEFNSPALKPFKNQLTLLIKTQVNAISNTDHNHLMSKVRLFVNLFSGRDVTFQDRNINASLHPQGQMFSMDLAAQTFVIVGTRLVNSVPAVAKSMATVINGITKSDMPIFRDLLMGHLQERCPYIIPMYPDLSELSDLTDEKYLSRMRSMVLLFGCVLMAPPNKGPAWTWLASFLSLKPEPSITATILQAFLQVTSSDLQSIYGRQYRKLYNFIKTDYVKMIEEVTKKPAERQPLIKLKNELN